MRGARGLGVSALFHTRPSRAHGHAAERGAWRAGRSLEPVSGVRALGGVLPCGMDNEAFLCSSSSITSLSSQEPAAAATATT